MLDKFAILPISACVFALIAFPIISFITAPDHAPFQVEARPEPRIFWPAMAAISVVLAVQSRSRFSKLVWPPHIVCLMVYFAFAGASILWAFKPDSSFVRFLQQTMVITSIVLPAMLAVRTVDLMRALFLCFALSLVLNLPFIFGGSVTIVMDRFKAVDIGYQGYFSTKNYLGECAAVAFLLAVHEATHPGWRRTSGITVVVISFLVVFLSRSKTAFALALIAPFVARLTSIIRKTTGLSPAIILLSLPFCYVILSHVSNFNMNRISYILFGDSTLTGRTIIWDFAKTEIDRSPLVGWGYQSFWLVGPDGPAVVDGPGWVRLMPNAHNGYYDTMLEMGYIGLALLLAFIVATLHAIGRALDRDPRHGRLLLSLTLFIICYNGFESLWMRGFENLWIVFLIVAAEIGRCWQPLPLRRAASPSRGPNPVRPGPLKGAQASWPRGSPEVVPENWTGG